MRPAARMPKLTRRSRTLIAIALTVIGLLLVGPRLIDAYVDWLWFGELGYRSVFSTVLVTRLVVFLVVGLLVGGIVFAGLALAYRTRPVFVPSNGNDPVARYRSVVMSRLPVIGAGVPVAIGLLAGVVAQTYWVRIQLFLHGGDFGVKRSAIRQRSWLLRLRPALLPACAQLLFRCGVPRFRRESVDALHFQRHPAVRAHRCAEPFGAYPVGQSGRNAGATQGGRLLAGPLRAAFAHPCR